MIGGSIFPHQRINKVNWRLPDHVTENQIDHICINKRFRKAWKDVRVIRIADNPSDHHLLTTAVRLRLRKFNNKQDKKVQCQPPQDRRSEDSIPHQPV